MKKLLLFILTLVILFSCVSKEEKIQKNYQKIINEYNNLHKKYAVLFEKEWIERDNEINNKLIKDSINILIPQLDSLMYIIEKNPNFIHPWNKEPFENILDELNKTYRLELSYENLYDVCSRQNNKQIQWNMEDINIIKNDIMKFLPFEPEKEMGKYGTLLWTTRTYKIEVYCTGNKNIEIKLYEN